MDIRQVQEVRRFNRVVTQRVGALEDSYLRRGRPLGVGRHEKLTPHIASPKDVTETTLHSPMETRQRGG